ncbi:hypothetical protein B0I35DRAFT_141796 [Stachybotrys elegans]|uniref:Uncharacterized protein n=1 Tax=Stachybotrys elegans TaxID=80388 RepID=A0A8K0T069_9HYPO|nr:hypothetical protein B0I35DRAFT_141796 [Stachybotrys elegans]
MGDPPRLGIVVDPRLCTLSRSLFFLGQFREGYLCPLSLSFSFLPPVSSQSISLSGKSLFSHAGAARGWVLKNNCVVAVGRRCCVGQGTTRQVALVSGAGQQVPAQGTEYSIWSRRMGLVAGTPLSSLPDRVWLVAMASKGTWMQYLLLQRARQGREGKGREGKDGGFPPQGRSKGGIRRRREAERGRRQECTAPTEVAKTKTASNSNPQATNQQQQQHTTR